MGKTLSTLTMGFFAKPLTTMPTILLKYVYEANYTGAQSMINASPAIMFAAVEVNGTKLSPLKLAFTLLDTYMWKMFLDKIKTYPNLRYAFQKQALESIEYLNLEPLFTAYQDYDDALKKYIAVLGIEKDARANLYQAWKSIGKAQRDILPRHMLKEFCRNGTNWHPTATFDVTAMPYPSVPVAMTHNSINHTYRLSQVLFQENEEPGFNYVLYNGGNSNFKSTSIAEYAVMEWAITNLSSCLPPPMGGLCIHYLHDLQTIQQLYQVRQQDLVNQILSDNIKPILNHFTEHDRFLDLPSEIETIIKAETCGPNAITQNEQKMMHYNQFGL